MGDVTAATSTFFFSKQSPDRPEGDKGVKGAFLFNNIAIVFPFFFGSVTTAIQRKERKKKDGWRKDESVWKSACNAASQGWDFVLG